MKGKTKKSEMAEAPKSKKQPKDMLKGKMSGMGKPVMVYLHPRDVELVPEAMRRDLPLIGANPDSVGEALGALVAMPRWQLREIGLASRRFVERWHRPADVARTVLERYG